MSIERRSVASSRCRSTARRSPPISMPRRRRSTIRGRAHERSATRRSVAGRMSAALLDTSVLIAFDAPGAVDLPASAAISVITLGELRAGVVRAHDPRTRASRQARLTAVRAAFTGVPVDEGIAEHYGDALA